MNTVAARWLVTAVRIAAGRDYTGSCYKAGGFGQKGTVMHFCENCIGTTLWGDPFSLCTPICPTTAPTRRDKNPWDKILEIRPTVGYILG